jgi:hypothetical protein
MTGPRVKLTAEAEVEIPDAYSHAFSLNTLIGLCHGEAVSAGWWHDLTTNESLVGKRNKAEMICLMHSELSEVMEGERKDLMDDKLPHRKMAEVELADTIIRIMDYAGAHGYDVGGALIEKLAYNRNRPDFKKESRSGQNGKKF